MDLNYLYSMVAFVIGGLAGFQGVYERYKKDSSKASTTFPGFFYLLTRALFPAAIFAGLYAYRLVESNLLVTALACGTGAELFLRTKIFIKQEQKGPGNTEDLSKGPLDLLRWYQNLFLESASTNLAQSKKAFVGKHLPATIPFQDLCERALGNIEAYNPPLPDLKIEVEKLKEEFEKDAGDNSVLDTMIAREIARVSGVQLEESDFKKAQAANDLLEKLERKYRYKLGYLIYNQVGRKGFDTLLSN